MHLHFTPNSSSVIERKKKESKGGGCQGDRIQGALLVSKGGKSDGEYECVCVMSGLPGQLMEQARAGAIM